MNKSLKGENRGPCGIRAQGPMGS